MIVAFPGLTALAAMIPAGLGLGALATGKTGRRLAVLLAMALLPIPFFVAGSPLERGITSLAAALILFRTIDLLRERTPRPWTQRAWQVVAIVDWRTVRRVGPAWSWSLAVGAVGYTVLSVGAAWLACRVFPSLTVVPRHALRWGAGLVFAYASFDALVAVIQLGYRALGWQLPVVHDAPIRSRTIAEFWGQRWNRVVNAWLRSTLFVPFARRRAPLVGIIAAFTVSVALHAYVAWAAVGRGPALMAAIFFGAQVPLLIAERYLGVARWPALAGRAWTIVLLSLLSPLFVEPVMRAFDPLFAG